MKRIGLIADTHVPEAGKALPGEVYEYLRDVDLILHGGDMHVIDVLDWLQELAPVLACRGNGDGDGWRPPFPDDDPRVKPAQVVEAEGLKVGLVHAFPMPGELPWITQDALMERHFGGRVDVVIFGDSHQEGIAELDGVLLINPGSPMLPRQMKAPGTISILTIDNGTASAEILRLTSLTP